LFGNEREKEMVMSLKLPKLGFGCAVLGGLFEEVPETQASDLLQLALERGISYFDTAPYYGFGLSERRTGDALRQRPDAILSTKVGRILKKGALQNPQDYGWPAALPFHPEFDYSYDGVMRSFEDSLQRLGRDRIDILYLHDIGPFMHTDPDTELAYFRSAMSGGYRALDELRASGDVRAIGIGVNDVETCLRVLDHGEWDLFLLAGRYTLLEQGAQDRLFPLCAQRDTKIVVGGPFNSGILVGGSTWDYGQAPEKVRSRVKSIARICNRHEVSMPAAALKFPMAHPVVASVIPGARSPQELLEILAWEKERIPADFWADLKHAGLMPDHTVTPA
jgi:D-threo-aldose 1-dehydrogenase